MEKDVVLLEGLPGSLLLTELHDRLEEAAGIWKSFDVWFDANEQAIVGRRKSTKMEVVR